MNAGNTEGKELTPILKRRFTRRQVVEGATRILGGALIGGIGFGVGRLTAQSSESSTELMPKAAVAPAYYRAEHSAVAMPENDENVSIFYPEMVGRDHQLIHVDSNTTIYNLTKKN